MATSLQIMLDTPQERFDEAVTFWSAVTGWTVSERRGENAQFVTLLPTTGAPYLKLQAVPGPAGVHLALDTDDRPASIARARDLGATTAWVYCGVEVMRSPGGFTFCQTLLEGNPAIGRDSSTILGQVCLDIPSSSWETEVAFWRDLTGREPRSFAEFARDHAGIFRQTDHAEAEVFAESG